MPLGLLKLCGCYRRGRWICSSMKRETSGERTGRSLFVEWWQCSQRDAHFNDLFYGVAKGNGRGIKIHALAANQSIMTCLANDLSYKEVFSAQLDLLANPGYAGSIVRKWKLGQYLAALQKAKDMKLSSVAILGFSGGAALNWRIFRSMYRSMTCRSRRCPDGRWPFADAMALRQKS